MPHAVLAAMLALLALAAPAQATITVSASGSTVIVAGDGGANRILLRDGDAPHAFAFSTEAEPVILQSGSTCVADNDVVECGTSSVNQAVFHLGAGNDRVEWSGDAAFEALAALGVDFGPGNDSNERGIRGIDTEIAGGEGDDQLFGHDGPASIVEGGPGDDTLVGGAGDDTISGGPGRDNVEAGDGNDTLILGDGEQDVAACGSGADSVTVDALDLLPIGDCESVTGAAPAGGGPPPKGGSVPGGSAKLALARPGRLSARRRTLSLKVRCPAAAAGSCSGRVTFTLRFTRRGKPRKVNAGRVSFILEPGASRRVSRKLSRKLVRRVRKGRKRTLTIRATSRDNAGRSFTSTRKAKLRLSR